METKKIYYGIDGQEQLDTDPYDTFGYEISNMSDDDIKGMTYPFIVKVFTPMCINIDTNDVLDMVLENLDENYGNPDGDATEATDAMKAKAEELVKVIKDEYVVWACEETGETIEYSKDDVLQVSGGCCG